MRWLVPLLMLALFSPAVSAGVNPVPALTLRIDPSSIHLNNSSATQTAVFNGTVSVDKLPRTRFNVSLTSSVDTGWPSLCTPSELDLTNNTRQNFTCTVSVPGNSGGLIGVLKIDARGQGSGFIAIATAQAIVAVEGTPKNQTGGTENQTATDNTTNTGNDPVFKAPDSSGPTFDKNMMMGVSVVLLLGVASVVVMGRRR